MALIGQWQGFEERGRSAAAGAPFPKFVSPLRHLPDTNFGNEAALAARHQPVYNPALRYR